MDKHKEIKEIVSRLIKRMRKIWTKEQEGEIRGRRRTVLICDDEKDILLVFAIELQNIM